MPLKTKKIPNRMCLGCREMKPKKELLRIVKSKEGLISIDPSGKKPGRGAYICFNIECLDKAQKAKRIEKEFETSVSPEVYYGLREELNKINAEE
ncbi:MAG: RNase P modulator RnpM [Ignavibacteriales bacterium]